MEKYLLFIPDLSLCAGRGHFYRCLRCACYLNKAGWTSVIAAPEIDAVTIAALREGRVKFLKLRDLKPETISRLARSIGLSPEWIVVDHYKLAASWEQRLRNLTKFKVAAFDDDDGRKHSCEMIIRTNELSLARGESAKAADSTAVRMLIGPRFYIPDLRMRKSNRKPTTKLRNILFFLGAACSSKQFIETLGVTVAALADTNLKISAIAPLALKHALPQRIRKRVKLIKNYKLLPKLLAQTDLYIGSGGTITFDRLLFNIPAIVVSMAANQDKLSKALAKRRSQLFLGSIDKLSSVRLTSAIKSVMGNSTVFSQLRERSSGIVDGRGGQRLNAHFRHFPISLRVARASDENSILKWRNDRRVRAASITTRIISARSHHEWFQRKLNDRNCAMLIAHSPNGAVAVLRYDLNKRQTHAIVSIFLTPAVIGSGLGSEVLKLGTKWICRNYPKLSHINAVIRRENIGSIRSFLSAGYRKRGKFYVIKMRLARKT